MTKKRDYLDGTELSPEETASLIERAVERKRNPSGAVPLRGKIFVLLFEKHSTRTRLSFEAAVVQLGGSSIFLSPNDTQLARGETLSDSAKVLSRYLNGIIVRTYGHDRIEEIARHATVPVVNGLTDTHHPCQALADYLTLRERFGTLEGRKMAYLGDGNNVLHSLLLVGAMLGVSVSAACPQGYLPDADVVERARGLAAASGAGIHVTDSVEEACEGAHGIYTDVWASMGQEEEAEARRHIFAPYRVHGELFHGAAEGAVFMHCLPAHRGEEVTSEVIDGPRSVVFEQAGNRLHAQKVLLEMLAGESDA